MGVLYRDLEVFAAKNNINMVPVYKPGAETKIGIQYAVSAEKSGNTMLMSLTSDMSDLASIQHFEPVTSLTVVDLVLVASAKSKIKTIQDISNIELAQPGKLNWVVSNSMHQKLTYAIADANKLSKEKITIIPYTAGNGQVLTGIASGDLDLTWVPKTVAADLNNNGIATIVAMDANTRQHLNSKQSAMQMAFTGRL